MRSLLGFLGAIASTLLIAGSAMAFYVQYDRVHVGTASGDFDNANGKGVFTESTDDKTWIKGDCFIQVKDEDEPLSCTGRANDFSDISGFIESVLPRWEVQLKARLGVRSGGRNSSSTKGVNADTNGVLEIYGDFEDYQSSRVIVGEPDPDAKPPADGYGTFTYKELSIRTGKWYKFTGFRIRPKDSDTEETNAVTFSEITLRTTRFASTLDFGYESSGFTEVRVSKDIATGAAGGAFNHSNKLDGSPDDSHWTGYVTVWDGGRPIMSWELK